MYLFPYANLVPEMLYCLIFFRGHLEDIYDLAWSPNGQQLISGSVDNSAIIWDVNKGGQIYFIYVGVYEAGIQQPSLLSCT